MKNIIFTINSSCGKQQFFLVADDSASIEMQIHDALADICFCDAYEVISYEETDEAYTESRRQLIELYESVCENTVEEAFCSGSYTTKEAILIDLCWNIKRYMEQYCSVLEVVQQGQLGLQTLNDSMSSAILEIQKAVGDLERLSSPSQNDSDVEKTCYDVDASEWKDGSEFGCWDCPESECTGHCMSCSYRPF